MVVAEVEVEVAHCRQRVVEQQKVGASGRQSRRVQLVLAMRSASVPRISEHGHAH